MAKVTAQLNGLRLAPRKVRAVIDLIKKRDVKDAIDQLHHMVRRPVPQLLRLINSAIATAENTYQMVRDNLYIKELVVNEGIKLKRYMPRAQGRATEVQKKTSNIKLILEEKIPGLKSEKKAAVAEKIAEKKEEVRELKAEEIKKPEIKREVGKKGLFGRIGKRIFSRKAV
ncbi:MAG TPA: 50S ribosomal protein L22 [Candidatus Paceibacterota bacterium]|nr:50S ribosomal protein L22 [Candidatus Paceibacterota bacterium]